MKKTNFSHLTTLPEFDRDLKKLIKKFPSLGNIHSDGDIRDCIESQLIPYHKMVVDNRGIFRIQNLPFSCPEIYKVKKFACRSLKGRGVASGIRITYAYFLQKDHIEFIEIYFKADQAKEDKERIILAYQGSKIFA